MPDDDIRDALRQLDRPARPDDEFSDALFRRLVVEAGRRPSLVRARSIERRRPALRRALTIAAVLAVAVVVIAAVLGPLRGLGSNTTPASPMPASPFRMTLEGSYPRSGDSDTPGNFRIQISYRDQNAWRIDVLGGTAAGQPLLDDVGEMSGVGSYVVWSNGTLAAYDASTGRFVPQEAHASWFSPLNLLGGDDPRSGWQKACQGGPSLGDAVIAGRPVHGIRCQAPPQFGSPGATVDVWQDVDTHLILRLVSSADPGQQFPPGPLMWYEGEAVVATSIEYDPAFSAGLFALPSPEPEASASPLVSVPLGDPLPSLTGTMLDGAPFDLSSTRGKPTVVYVWANWCPPCVGTPLDALQSEYRSRTDVNIVTVADAADPASMRGYMENHGYTFPVVLPDSEASLIHTWGLGGIPAMILLDASGRVVAVYGALNTEVGGADEIVGVIDAFAAGEPLPNPSPAFRSAELPSGG